MGLTFDTRTLGVLVKQLRLRRLFFGEQRGSKKINLLQGEASTPCFANAKIVMDKRSRPTNPLKWSMDKMMTKRNRQTHEAKTNETKLPTPFYLSRSTSQVMLERRHPGSLKGMKMRSFPLNICCGLFIGIG